MAVGRYYRITPRFWLDRDIRNEWTEDMRLLALYLLTSPHRNMVGLFHLPPSYGTSDLQWVGERFRNGFEGLLKAAFIEYDPDSQVVLIPNAVRYDPPSNNNQVKGALNALANVPDNALFLRLADCCDEAAADLADEPLAAARCQALAQAIRNRYAKRFETESKPNRTTVPDTDTDTVSASDRAPDADDTSAPLSGVPYPAIVNAYHLQCGGWPRVGMLTEDRRKAIRQWWAQIMDVHKFELAFQKANASDFLSGRNGRWQSPAPCDFDWLLKDSNLAAVLEGKYDNRAPRHAPASDKPVERTVSLEEARQLTARTRK